VPWHIATRTPSITLFQTRGSLARNAMASSDSSPDEEPAMFGSSAQRSWLPRTQGIFLRAEGDDLHGKPAIADQIARADDCRASQPLGLRKGVVQGVDVSMNVGDDSEAHDYTMADLHSVRNRLTRCLGAGGSSSNRWNAARSSATLTGSVQARHLASRVQSLGGETVVPLTQVRR